MKGEKGKASGGSSAPMDFIPKTTAGSGKKGNSAAQPLPKLRPKSEAPLEKSGVVDSKSVDQKKNIVTKELDKAANQKISPAIKKQAKDADQKKRPTIKATKGGNKKKKADATVPASKIPEGMFNLLHVESIRARRSVLQSLELFLALTPLVIIGFVVLDIIAYGDLDLLIPMGFLLAIILFLLRIGKENNLSQAPIEVYENGISMPVFQGVMRANQRMLTAAIATSIITIPILLLIGPDLRIFIFEAPMLFLIFSGLLLIYNHNQEKARRPLYKVQENPRDLKFVPKMGRKNSLAKAVKGIYLTNSDASVKVFNELTVVTIDNVTYESGPRDQVELRKIAKIIQNSYGKRD